MKRAILNYLTSFHSKKQSTAYKLISLALGMLFFLVILPAAFVWVGFILKPVINLSLGGTIELVISIVSIAIGVFFLTWTTISQWKIGMGIPTPNAPTQHLVTTGPYKLCRNPIELGAIFYYLGIGTIVGGIVVGVCCFLLGLAIGSAYHKFIEESELELRFGDEYRQYKKDTPFLFPRVRLNRK